MDNRPIGVFDSGVGGLTAVRELQKILPGEDIIYFGDTGRVPYGTRSAETIKKYATQAIKYLSGFNVKAILAACGTVSSNFNLEDYQKLNIDIPYITVVKPAAVEGVIATKNNRIGIMATSASIKSGAYEREIKEICNNCATIGVGCPLLVMLVENGLTEKNHPVPKAVLEMYLEPIIQSGVDTIILGCTHFPLLRDAISEIVGKDISLVDSGGAAARNLEKTLKDMDGLCDREKGKAEFYVTDTVESFLSVAKNFLSEDIADVVNYVDIDIIDK